MTTIHITVAMKPIESTFLGNSIEHGVSGLNVDGTRIAGLDPNNAKRLGRKYSEMKSDTFGQIRGAVVCGSLKGRYPANIILSSSIEVIKNFPHTKTGALSRKAAVSAFGGKGIYSQAKGEGIGNTDYGADEGSAARYFKEL